MADILWYRSLYWRIALGFVGLVAVLLALQVAAFLWISGRAAEFFGESPAAFVQTVASNLSAALAADPAIDADAYLNERYRGSPRAFAVAFVDGRIVVSRRVPPPPNMGRAALLRLRGAASGRGGFGGRGGQAFEFASVLLQGAPAAMVATPRGAPPLWVTLRAFGPTLAAITVLLLVTGTAVAALVIFRPIHRRLRALQDAARAIGTGRAGVRAEEPGGDEVASLARTFNEMAARLEERDRALAVAEQARRQLLADVSHELTTPLSAIRGYVETMAMESVPLDEGTRRRYLGIVHEETSRLEQIIGDLLDLARLEGRGGALRTEAVSTGWLCDRVRDRHGPVLRERRIQLECGVSPDATAVAADPLRIEQALQNLVSNAVRHTPDSGSVRVTIDRAGDRIRMVVEDSGAGIPPEHLPRVFDRFYKVDVSRTGTAVPSGSGLGLSIVQAIARRHGGDVTAGASELGGARFELLLPSAAGDREARPTAAAGV
jgi:signal transduction histidine kinase